MVRVLAMGQCAIELDGRRLSTESEVVFGLVLYLAARAGEAITRDDLQALLWPGLSSTRGRHCLRQAAYRIRQLGVALRADNDALGIALGDVGSDFAALIGNDVPAARFANVPIGDILPGYQPRFSQPFAAWVEDYRTSIGGRIRKGLVRAIVDLRSKGRYREAEPLARLCLTSDPFNEVATLTLAEATAVLSGNRAEALAILDRYMDEVDTSPDRRLSLTASVLRRRISERFVEQRYAAPPDPPFVGREDILQLLVEKMQEAVAGRSTIVYVWGEPGIGKTRLLEELAKVAHVQGVRIARYAVTPNDPDRPLALFSSLLPRLMRMPGAVGISPEAFEAIQRFIDPSAWERVEPPANAAEAAVTFGRLKSGICELFEVLSEERPLGLFVDDVHWIDPRSLEVLAELAERVRGRRVALILSSREPAGVSRKSSLDAVCARAAIRSLEGLAATEIEALLERIAEQRNFTLTSEFVRRTVDTSAGNPLFVSELATHYGWNGVRHDLPPNMHTLLQMRLDALSPDALLVFQTCAAFGEHATVDRVKRTLQIPTRNMLLSLTELEGASLLAANAKRLLYRHELLRGEALRRITPVARETLFRRTATILEEAALSEMSAALCWHAAQMWLDTNHSDRAVRLVKTMAGRLLGSGLGRDAASLLDRARDALRDEMIATALIPLQWRAARAKGDIRRARDLALECQQLQQKLGPANGEANYAEFAAFDASRLLDFEPARDRFDIARLESSTEPAHVLIEHAIRVLVRADDALDVAAAELCYEALERRQLLRHSARSRRTLFELLYHSHFGKLDVAVEKARQILSARLGERTNDLSVEVRERRWAHRPLLLAARFAEALSALDQSLARARQCESAFDEVVSRCYSVEALLHSNRVEEALAELSVIEKLNPEEHGQFILTSFFITRSYAMLGGQHMGELEYSLENAERAVPFTPLNRQQVIVDALRVFQSLLLRQDPDPERLERLTACWNVASRISSADAPFLALCAAALVRGDSQAAHQTCVEYQSARRERFPIPEFLLRPFSNILSQYGVSSPGIVKLVATNWPMGETS